MSSGLRAYLHRKFDGVDDTRSFAEAGRRSVLPADARVAGVPQR